MSYENQSYFLKPIHHLLRRLAHHPPLDSEYPNISIHLATLLLNAMHDNLSDSDRSFFKRQSFLVQDDPSKSFLLHFTDQACRSTDLKRCVLQLQFLIHHYGLSTYFTFFEKIKLTFFKWFGSFFPILFFRLLLRQMQHQLSHLIISSDHLKAHHALRQKDYIATNFNYLGESILSESDAIKRLEQYQDMLSSEHIDHLSIKLSSLYSQINFLSFDQTTSILSERLTQLLDHNLKQKTPKSIHFDMESYDDLRLTVMLFKSILSQSKYFSLRVSIALQAYLPDSFLIQKELTTWAIDRHKKGGVPISIRLVKGANRHIELIQSEQNHWHSPIFPTKTDTDAQFKRMLLYACEPSHIKIVHLGIASHNLFDIAFALIIRSSLKLEDYIHFEMLEGMATPLMHLVHQLTQSVLIYCPTTDFNYFDQAMAYFVRRLDEHSSHLHFMRYFYDLNVGSKSWNEQKNIFLDSFHHIPSLPEPRFSRQKAMPKEPFFVPISNTDWANPDSHTAIQDYYQHPLFASDIPLCIQNQTLYQKPYQIGFSPNDLNTPLYHYAVADLHLLDRALSCATDHQTSFEACPLDDKLSIFKTLAQLLFSNRFSLMATLLHDIAKPFDESDLEVSEAIDFVHYYIHQVQHSDVFQLDQGKAHGVSLVLAPWNFPIGITTHCLVSALLTGHTVLLKPAAESVLSCFHLASLFWQAGVPKTVLQFTPFDESLYGDQVIKDPRIQLVLLTGSNQTAKHLLTCRPGLNLLAETGGKNTITVTGMADLDLAVKSIIQSAFGYSGQKCSAASLVLCEEKIYYKSDFLEQLKAAAESLDVGPSTTPGSRIIPLIRAPSNSLYHHLTTLNTGESWLLQPKNIHDQINHWSCGIKLGIQPGDHFHHTELFGPVLGIMPVKNLEQAIGFSNATSYGLTAGLQSLDSREQSIWIKQINCGNCYINQAITGARVGYQPFGGMKESKFGAGFKSGGPHTLVGFKKFHKLKDPIIMDDLPDVLSPILDYCSHFYPHLSTTPLWLNSLNSYVHWVSYFQNSHPLHTTLGTLNQLSFCSYSSLGVFVDSEDSFLYWGRLLALFMLLDYPVHFCFPLSFKPLSIQTFLANHPHITASFLSLPEFNSLVSNGFFNAIRISSSASRHPFLDCFSSQGLIIDQAIVEHGFHELSLYFTEKVISINRHRYGTLIEPGKIL